MADGFSELLWRVFMGFAYLNPVSGTVLGSSKLPSSFVGNEHAARYLSVAVNIYSI